MNGFDFFLIVEYKMELPLLFLLLTWYQAAILAIKLIQPLDRFCSCLDTFWKVSRLP